MTIRTRAKAAATTWVTPILTRLRFMILPSFRLRANANRPRVAAAHASHRLSPRPDAGLHAPDPHLDSPTPRGGRQASVKFGVQEGNRIQIETVPGANSAHEYIPVS